LIRYFPLSSRYRRRLSWLLFHHRIAHRWWTFGRSALRLPPRAHPEDPQAGHRS